MKRIFGILGMGWSSSSWAAPASAPGCSPALAGQWVGGLMLVLAVILLCLWVLRNLNRWGAPVSSQLRLLGGLSLGSREKLVVVEVGRTQLVLGVAPGRVQTLHILEGEHRLQQPDIQPFARQLQQMLARPGEKTS